MYEKEKQEILKAAKYMDKYQLIALSGGNISMRMPYGNFLITPSAMLYDDMVPEDIVLVDKNGNTLEGIRRPSSDMKAVLYIFEHMPDVNAVIHTHQPYATAVGLIGDELPACMVTIIDANKASVPVAPFTRSSDEGMGKLTVEYAGDALAVILKHHGVMAFGKSLMEALESAVYLEEASKAYLMAKAVGEVPMLTQEDIDSEGEERGYYGQPV
jgi:L-ribulose-5-phosphate 4-epimerase